MDAYARANQAYWQLSYSAVNLLFVAAPSSRRNSWTPKREPSVLASLSTVNLLFVAAPPSSWRIRSAPAARPRPIFGSQCVFSVFSVCFQCDVRELRTACGLCFLNVFMRQSVCSQCVFSGVTRFPVCFQCVFAFHECIYLRGLRGKLPHFEFKFLLDFDVYGGPGVMTRHSRMQVRDQT